MQKSGFVHVSRIIDRRHSHARKKKHALFFFITENMWIAGSTHHHTITIQQRACEGAPPHETTENKIKKRPRSNNTTFHRLCTTVWHYIMQ